MNILSNTILIDRCKISEIKNVKNNFTFYTWHEQIIIKRLQREKEANDSIIKKFLLKLSDLFVKSSKNGKIIDNRFLVIEDKLHLQFDYNIFVPEFNKFFIYKNFIMFRNIEYRWNWSILSESEKSYTLFANNSLIGGFIGDNLKWTAVLTNNWNTPFCLTFNDLHNPHIYNEISKRIKISLIDD